jgi:hypothetical protein
MSQPLTQIEPYVSASVLPRRLFALIIDFFVIGFLAWVAAFFILIFGFFTLGIGWLTFHIMPVLPFAYYTLLVGSSGATPGQRRTPASPRLPWPRPSSGRCCSGSASSSPASPSCSCCSTRAAAPRMIFCQGW